MLLADGYSFDVLCNTLKDVNFLADYAMLWNTFLREKEFLLQYMQVEIKI